MSKKMKSIGTICADWWKVEINAETGRARMVRAQLRRAEGVVATLGVAAVHDLNTALRAEGYDLSHGNGPERLALIAVALAYVKEGHGRRAAQAFGAGEPKALSDIRFNALIRATDTAILWTPLIRALEAIKGQANVPTLACDIFYWNDNTRTRWCFDYYGELYAPLKP